MQHSMMSDGEKIYLKNGIFMTGLSVWNFGEKDINVLFQIQMRRGAFMIAEQATYLVGVIR